MALRDEEARRVVVDAEAMRMSNEALRYHTATRSREVDWLSSMLAALRRDNDRLRADREALDVDLRRSRDEVAALGRGAADAASELRDADQRIRGLASELSRASQRIDDLQASGSWRLTGPLRAFKRLLMRVGLS